MKLITDTSEQKAHAKFSASGSSRWLHCPGSMLLSERAPPQRESPYALEGTQAHSCLEFLLKNRANLKAAIKLASKNYESEMVEHATDAVIEIQKMQKLYPGSELLIETKVDASPFTCAGQFGTLDVAIVQEFGTLVVIDYKYGAGVAVDPDNNPQLIYYALGISNQYDHNFARCELVVIQPRAFHESGNTTRSASMTMAELITWEHVFRTGVRDCQKPDAPLSAGPWCKFCPAATICPEIKDKALKAAQVVFDDEVGVESVPEPMGIAINNLGVILDACDKLESWIEKVRDHAIHVLERGEKVEGFKLVQKKSPRRWIDPDAAAKIAKKKLGAKAFTEPKLLSPAQIEKQFSNKSEGHNDTQWIHELITNESSGTTLVRESDKRPAVVALAWAEDVSSFDMISPPVEATKKPKVMNKTKRP